MKYRILCIGKIKDSYYRDEISAIQKNIARKQSSLEILEFPDEKIPDHLNEKQKKQILEKEGKRFLNRITNKDYVVALCIEGKEMTTNQHGEILKKAKEDGAEVTDDCSAVERLGMSVKIVEGDERNIKVTTPLDLVIAKLLLEEMK